MDIVRAIRNLRAEKQVKPGKKISATFMAGSQTKLLEEQAYIIVALCHLDSELLTFNKSMDDKPEGNVGLVVGPVEIYLPLNELVDPVEEKVRLEKDLNEAKEQIGRLEKLLKSSFSEKAPPNVVGKEREKLNGFKETADKIKGQLEELK